MLIWTKLERYWMGTSLLDDLCMSPSQSATVAGAGGQLTDNNRKWLTRERTRLRPPGHCSLPSSKQYKVWRVSSPPSSPASVVWSVYNQSESAGGVNITPSLFVRTQILPHSQHSTELAGVGWEDGMGWPRSPQYLLLVVASLQFWVAQT